MRTSKNQSKGTREFGNLPRKALSCLASAALASTTLPAAALAIDTIGYADDDAPPPGASDHAAAPSGPATSPDNSAPGVPTAPPFAVQTKTYNGAVQTYELEGYQIAYSQNGKSATPRNAGSYDVTINRPASESDSETSVTLIGGLVIERAKLTIAADNKNMVIGKMPPSFTYTCTGLVEGDELGFAPKFSCEFNSKVPGTYQIGITATTSVNGTPTEVKQTANYDIEFIPGILEVLASTTTTPPAPPAESEPKPTPLPESSAPTAPATPSPEPESPAPAPTPTPAQPEAPATPSNPDAAEAPQRPAAGDIATIGTGASLLRFAIVTPAGENGRGGTAAVIGCAKSARTINVPAKVEISGATYRVTSISAGAFKNSKKLEKVTMAKSVAAIGARSLDGCAKLTSFTVGSGVKRIGSRALRGCKSLTTVTITAKRLPQSPINNLVAGSRVKTVVVHGDAASLKKYQKQFSREKCGKKGIVVKRA